MDELLGIADESMTLEWNLLFVRFHIPDDDHRKDPGVDQILDSVRY